MYVCSCECVCLLRKVCDLSAQQLDIKQMSLAADLGIRALVSCLPGIMLVSVRALGLGLLAIVAMFDILFA